MDPILGEIQLYSFSFDMEHWMRCEGQIIPIDENPALYSLLGTIYGGNGTTTFALPNLKGAEPVPGMSYYISTQGNYPQRS